jgi:hypothetical protein
MALYCHVKGDEACTWQVSTATVEDVIQDNKEKATIETDDRYDVG